MYSVIQPTEVLDDNDEMISTWIVLAVDLPTLDMGLEWMDENIEEEMIVHTWVVRTSDILKFNHIALGNIVLAYDDDPQPPKFE